ncbi:DUF2511 domain-containing protein [Pseudomonas sp. SA3-5]|uniref:DUF2511 domain-containing protein n=1 Tax=Pseudomonas aestuarii TaxID=3018340 RepID=A0ABT4XEA5_9PSED|nr:DUF2511 domain-containing protein [Pseudomonas aestuarii]MDA7086522.1 DUF2511 domain-containing protein [Pseudomonas aestuarii]
MTRNGLFGLAIAGLLLAVTAAAAANIELVSAEDYGQDWPFKGEEMHLLCMPGNAVVASDPESGRMYPLNGTASSQAKRLGLDPLEAIWLDNPAIPGTKVSVGPLIERGLALCKS